MVCTPGPISRPTKGENDDADRPPGCAEDLRVVSANYTVGILDEILRVLERWPAERRINVHGHASAWTDTHEFRGASVTGPLRRDRIVPARGSLLPRTEKINCFEA